MPCLGEGGKIFEADLCVCVGGVCVRVCVRDGVCVRWLSVPRPVLAVDVTAD